MYDPVSFSFYLHTLFCLARFREEVLPAAAFREKRQHNSNHNHNNNNQNNNREEKGCISAFRPGGLGVVTPPLSRFSFEVAGGEHYLWKKTGLERIKKRKIVLRHKRVTVFHRKLSRFEYLLSTSQVSAFRPPPFLSLTALEQSADSRTHRVACART